MIEDEYGEYDEEMARHRAIERQINRGMSADEAERYVDARARRIDNILDELSDDETDDEREHEDWLV